MSLKTLYDFKVNTIDGKPADLSQYNGKKALIVNVATYCGNTPQYKGLQELSEKFKDKLVVLGFPANNFGKQEPGTNEEIKNFCEEEYHVTFPMFEKISVTGDDTHPLYKWLSSKEENGWNDQPPTWNFSKYLTDENGKLIKYFSDELDPMSDEIISELK